jgi:hypothetical protein
MDSGNISGQSCLCVPIARSLRTYSFPHLEKVRETKKDVMDSQSTGGQSSLGVPIDSPESNGSGSLTKAETEPIDPEQLTIYLTALQRYQTELDIAQNTLPPKEFQELEELLLENQRKSTTGFRMLLHWTTTVVEYCEKSMEKQFNR